MPKRYLRNPLLVFRNPYLVGIIILALFTWVMTWYFSPEQLLNIYSTPMAALAAWGCFKWGGGSMQALLDGDVSKEALGVMGVFLIMVFITLTRINTVGVISLGWPTYEQSYTSAFLVLFALVGVTMFALASRNDDPLKPKSPRTASFITGFFSAALLIFSGALHGVVVHFGKLWKMAISFFS